MESTGKPGRVQVSTETVELLREFGKGHWFESRESKVLVKGKGEMNTFWLKTNTTSLACTDSGEATSMNQSVHSKDIRADTSDLNSDKTKRLIDWNVEVLARALKQIVVHRNTVIRAHRETEFSSSSDAGSSTSAWAVDEGKTVLDEVCEIIELPDIINKTTAELPQNVDSIVLAENVVEQLTDYVTSLSVLYRNNVSGILCRRLALFFRDQTLLPASFHDFW